MNQIIVMVAMGFAALLGAIGQIMLKLSSEKLKLTIPSLLTNWPLYAFVLTYGVAVIINIWAYKAGGKVAVIYPVIALSYIFAALIAWKFLGESITIWTWVGTITIIFGVAMIGYGATWA